MRVEDEQKIIGGKIDILGVTTGIMPDNPILLTIGFEVDGKRMVLVKGLSITQADSLQSQLGWSMMDWAETRKEGGDAH